MTSYPPPTHFNFHLHSFHTSIHFSQSFFCNVLVSTWPKDMSYRNVTDTLNLMNETGRFGCKKYGSEDYFCLCDFYGCNNNHQEYLKWYLRHFTTTTTTTTRAPPTTTKNNPSSSALSSISVTLLISALLVLILS